MTLVDPRILKSSFIPVILEYRGASATAEPSPRETVSSFIASTHSRRLMSRGLSQSTDVTSGIVTPLMSTRLARVIPETALTTRLALAKFIRLLGRNLKRRTIEFAWYT